MYSIEKQEYVPDRKWAGVLEVLVEVKEWEY
jgi:hypothetical protein